MMSTTNNNVGKFHQQHASENDDVTKHRQQHNVWLKCVHCGRHQSVTVLVPSNVTTDVVEAKPTGAVSFREFDSHGHTPTHGGNDQQTNDSSRSLRFAPIVDDKNDAQNDINPPLHRSDYALQFVRFRDDDDDRKAALERNINGFVGECVRSSVHEVSLVKREGDTQEYVEVEFDSVLGNVKSTRKRSSTIITNLDNDRYNKPGYRHQSLNTRYQPASPQLVNTDRDDQPIYARRRLSHSTVKPSDLVREHDKKDKLQATALRRLSRADQAGEDVVPNSTRFFDPAAIKATILRWCQDCTQFYRGVSIRNFSSSWNDGLAFCALIHRYFPDEFNFETLRSNEPRQNFDLAFTVALERAGIEPLIDTDDMLLMGNKPDSKVVFTYVQSIYRRLSRVQPPAMMRERW